jgi:hypothetical protein
MYLTYKNILLGDDSFNEKIVQSWVRALLEIS